MNNDRSSFLYSDASCALDDAIREHPGHDKIEFLEALKEQIEHELRVDEMNKSKGGGCEMKYYNDIIFTLRRMKELFDFREAK